MRYDLWPMLLKLPGMLPCALCCRGMPPRKRNIWQALIRSGLTAPVQPTLTNAQAVQCCWWAIRWAVCWHWIWPQRPLRVGSRPRRACSCWQRRFFCGVCIPFFLLTGACHCCPCGTACSQCGGYLHGLRRAELLLPGRDMKLCVHTDTCSS